MIYIKLGSRASSYYDPTSKVSLAGSEILELEAIPSSKGFQKSLHAGHIVLTSQVDYKAWVAKNAPVVPEKTESEEDEDTGTSDDSMYIMPTTTSEEDVMVCIGEINTADELIAWAKFFGFKKQEIKSLRKLADVVEMKKAIVEICATYEL